METGDFRANERSLTLSRATTARIEHVAEDGGVTTLKSGVALQEGELLDASFMSRKALVAFLQEQVRDAREQGVLFSLHLKATMMKVSDPIIFGHAVRVYFENVFERHGELLDEIGFDPDDGLADLMSRLEKLPAPKRAAVEAAIQSAYEQGPGIAMVNSDRGITNLHVPSDVIIDASMPPMIRDSGRMWNADGELQDCKAVIPESSYAPIYDVVIRDCQAHGQFDPTTMGTVPNVGLMAQKAEEYGSHDKTFEFPRQDLRNRGAGHREDRRPRRSDPPGAPGRDRGHLEGVPDEGRSHSGLGEAGGEPGPGYGESGDLLARPGAGP